jgi:hypothetical protein
MSEILFLQELGEFKVRTNDMWPLDDPDSDDSDSDDDDHEDTDDSEDKIDNIDDLITDEEVDPDSDEPEIDDTFCDDVEFGGPGSGRHAEGSSEEAIANAAEGAPKQTHEALTNMHSALVSAGYQRTSGLNYRHTSGNTASLSPAPRQRSGVYEIRDKNGDHKSHGYGSLALKSDLGLA